MLTPLPRRRFKSGIRPDGGLQVKLLQVELGRNQITVLSDNPAHEARRLLTVEDIQVLGRVIWPGRQIGS